MVPCAISVRCTAGTHSSIRYCCYCRHSRDVLSMTTITSPKTTTTTTTTTTTINTDSFTKDNNQQLRMLSRTTSTYLSQQETSKTTSSLKALYTLRGLYRSLKTPYLPESVLDKYNHQQTTKTTTTTNKNDNIITKPVPISNKNRSNGTTKFLLDQYRQYNKNNNKNKNSTTNNINDDLIEIVNGTYQLKNDINERLKLLLLDTGVEELLSPMEMSRRAAARAGLLLPESNDEMDQRLGSTSTFTTSTETTETTETTTETKR
jgi:phage terminase large subunit GpA-like protein